jgi:hypothetical protein
MRYVVVDSVTGHVVGSLPDPGVNEDWDPILSTDGTRVFGVWSEDWDARAATPSGPERVGYLNLADGRFTTIQMQPTGDIDALTVSADGSTLAYEWDRTPNGEDTDISIVVRNVATGHQITMDHEPAGPIETLLALSPNGDRLALMPTAGGASYRMLVLPLHSPDPLAAATTVEDGCPASAKHPDNEPQWTAAGLFIARACTGGSATSRAGIVALQGPRFRAHTLKGPSATISSRSSRTPDGYAVLAGASPVFVVQDGDGRLHIVNPSSLGQRLPAPSGISLTQELGG